MTSILSSFYLILFHLFDIAIIDIQEEQRDSGRFFFSLLIFIRTSSIENK